jgi:peptidoglycan/LPS O-acetylase OafA/YrhL
MSGIGIKSAHAFAAEGLSALWSRPKGQVPGLDALRTLAVLMVVTGHYFGDFSTLTDTNLAIGKFPLIHFGWSGVDLFFILSGFLIGRQLWAEHLRRNTIDVPQFLVRRGLRIWPYYFAFIAWAMWSSGEPLSKYLPDIFFYSNYTDNGISGGWSLSTEEQFYILVPLLILVTAKFCPLEKQWMLWLGLFALLPLFRYITLSFYDGPIVDPLPVHLIYTPFHTHSDGLFAGLIIAWVSVMRPRHLEPTTFGRNFAMLMCFVVVGGVLRVLDKFLFAYTGLAVIFAGMAMFVLRDRSLFSRLADNRVFFVLSRLSYAMYLNHFAILAWAMPVLVAWLAQHQLATGHAGFLLAYAVILGMSIAFAVITFVTIESPFLRLRDRWIANRKRAQAPQVATG